MRNSFFMLFSIQNHNGGGLGGWISFSSLPISMTVPFISIFRNQIFNPMARDADGHYVVDGSFVTGEYILTYIFLNILVVSSVIWELQ